jgi:LemA protein
MLIAIYVIAAAIIVIFVLLYNRLISLVNMSKEAASGIDVQLKRRYDLVPNLIDVVKGYAKHEKSLFEKVAATRSDCIKTQNLVSKADMENKLALGIDRLIAIAENYPELKAGENFIKLQQDLVEIEDNIQYARRYYNGVIRDYNNAVQTFPGLLVAKTFNFKCKDYFELKDPEERKIVPAEF